MAACAGTDEGDGANDAAEDGASQEPDAREAPAPELDLETLQAQTSQGTIQAEPYPWENTYVGAVNDDLYIAVSLSEGADTEQPQEAIVYLCDGEEMGERVTGEVGAGTKTLEGEEVRVELSLADDAVRGTVTLDGEEPQPFAANEASGDADLYVAEPTFDDTDYWAGWVVLPDGSQRGIIFICPCPDEPLCGCLSRN
jgi:hypothetical protein